jgi:hypothetical protein
MRKINGVIEVYIEIFDIVNVRAILECIHPGIIGGYVRGGTCGKSLLQGLVQVTLADTRTKIQKIQQFSNTQMAVCPENVFVPQYEEVLVWQIHENRYNETL